MDGGKLKKKENKSIQSQMVDGVFVFGHNPENEIIEIESDDDFLPSTPKKEDTNKNDNDRPDSRTDFISNHSFEMGMTPEKEIETPKPAKKPVESSIKNFIHDNLPNAYQQIDTLNQQCRERWFQYLRLEDKYKILKEDLTSYQKANKRYRDEKIKIINDFERLDQELLENTNKNKNERNN